MTGNLSAAVQGYQIGVYLEAVAETSRQHRDGFLLFTVGDPNNVLSSRFIQSQVWARGFRPALTFFTTDTRHLKPNPAKPELNIDD